MKYCRHCGAEIQDIASVCVKCGIPVNKAVTGDKAFCRFCGAEMNSQAVLCTKCGATQENTYETGISYNPNLSSGKLTRCSEGKILAGVCNGIGKKMDINPWIVRAILIILHFFGIGFLLDIVYIIMIFALPMEE